MTDEDLQDDESSSESSQKSQTNISKLQE